jgi:radical SAM-linked protein
MTATEPDAGAAPAPAPAERWVRIRVRFGKRGRLRFLGQLDLQRGIERALRRSRLPARFTEGFHPRMRMSFPCASPTGMSSSCEVLEIQVTDPCPVAEVRARLAAELGDELPVFEVEVVPDGERLRLLAATYAITRRAGGPPVPSGALAALAVREDALPAVKRGKTVDLRPFLLSASGGDDAARIGIRFLETGATARPEDFLAFVGAAPADFLLERTGLRVELRRGTAVEERDLGA